MNTQNAIYVGNIAWRTTEQEIGDTFANFGYVNNVKIITDKETGRSKGFGFVEFQEPELIPHVIAQMNGYNLNGRQLRVNRASGTTNNNQGQGGQGGQNGQRQQQGNMGMQGQQQMNFMQQPQQQMGQQIGGGQAMGGGYQMPVQNQMGMGDSGMGNSHYQGGFPQQ